MAVVAGVLSETQRRTLEAVCDTFAPSVEANGDDPVMRDYLARAASDLGVASQIEGLMADAMMPEEIAAVGEFLDALAQHDFASLPLDARTQIIHQTRDSSPEAKGAVHDLKGLTFLFFYALPDEQGRNPNWEALGYPGPISAPPSPEDAPKTIPIEEIPSGGATLSADAVVIGSGAGGAVIAAGLAEAGKSVVVLEMGAYRNEADFKQLEVPGMFELYLNGGLLSSEDGSISIFAGSTLGGGTVVNYMNSIRTPEHIRREWAEHGIEGIDAIEYEQHIDAIWDRLSVNQEATTQNRTHRKLIEALEAEGHEHKPITRNADAQCDDPRMCGYCSLGCQKGCKQSTLKTFLQDAADHGAKFVVNCHADRILSEDGRATGVEATVTYEDGTSATLTVEAPVVVAACGAVETPALLLRSGIGGPAAGKHLRLHPALSVYGVYDEPIEGWIGQIQSTVSYAFRDLEEGCGFLIEAVGHSPAISSMVFPWEDGETHKRELSRTFKHTAPFLTVARDHGEGEVVLDDHGRPLIRWSLNDEVDRRLVTRAFVELAKLQRVAGAKEIHLLTGKPVRWREGEDFDEFVRAIESMSLDPHDVVIYTAHQMGSARMGSDPSHYVADGRGELHDTKGVWIGDASAFPTAPGVNPMISIMSLAHRTAGEIVAAA